MPEIVVGFRDGTVKRYDSSYRYDYIEQGLVLRVSATHSSWHIDYPVELIAYVAYTGSARF